MYADRILREELISRIMTSEQAAQLFKDKMVVASSGFTKAGDSKAVLAAVAERAKKEPLKITLMTGASLGHGTDGVLAESDALSLRLPFQVDPVLRKAINKAEVLFIDQHLGETVTLLKSNHFPKIDIAVLEATLIEADGSIIPTTSVGNSASFAALADQVIIEVNTAIPFSICGLHDIFSAGEYPNRSEIPIVAGADRIGRSSIYIDPKKIIGVVLTNKTDSPAEIAPPDESTTAIARHLVNFFSEEVKKGHLSKSLLPLQAGIGKVANAVLHGFMDGEFENLTMYSEVLQDSTFDLLDSGKMTFASGSSITVSEAYYQKIFNNFESYKDKIILRPQEISNAGEVIRRLGVIAINTGLECDIYGNVNSTHVAGTDMMNGIGGSGDFARNAYMSVFVTQSAAKSNTISRIVPMVSHVDHTEHDVDVIVTEQGLADLRGLAPRQRAKVIIENCAHPDYREELLDYFERACVRGGQTPHLLEEAFSWYSRLREMGTMKKFAD
ncbi:acetyl-CoA hydrolase/transferase family protein [Pedobacter gandavensis]|uniref:acetyl-CoA hydrolase/transferase family protein n=1 Tax=Pedobacter gandavensis TaxID=2679963 RepID=UPI002931AAAC|nr:acetyl-CoA hydrolase/transferase family protein [Pedobacter gandavensis]